MVMNSDSHWEPPLREPLLITVHRVAEILDVTLSAAYLICGSLDQRFYGPTETRSRVTMASLREFIELRDAGLPAREIMWQRKTYGYSLTEQRGLTPRSASHWHRANQPRRPVEVYEPRPTQNRFKRRRWGE